MPSKLSLSKYLKEWLENSVKNTVAPRTYSDYSELVSRYIDPGIGHIKMSKLEPIHIQTFYRTLAERLSPRTVRYVHNVLRRALKQAERWGMVMRNVAALVDPPRMQRQKIPRAMDFDQVEAFLNAARFDRYFALWVLALDTDMRPEEFLSLTWDDISLDKREVNVHRLICWNRKGGGYYFDDLKTPESRRVITVAPATIESLREWKATQESWRANTKWANRKSGFHYSRWQTDTSFQ